MSLPVHKQPPTQPKTCWVCGDSLPPIGSAVSAYRIQRATVCESCYESYLEWAFWREHRDRRQDGDLPPDLVVFEIVPDHD
jgi:hypothetical protein